MKEFWNKAKDYFDELKAKMQARLDARFTKKQQTLGVFSALVVLLILCMVLIFTDNVPFTGGKNNDTAQNQVKPKDDKEKDEKEEEIPIEMIEQDGMPADYKDEGKIIIENAKEINVPEIAETNARLVDSSEHFVLFIGHGGVLSLYDKKEETFIQVDNPVAYARISDDEKFIAYTMDGALTSELRVYNMEKKLVEQILRKENVYFSDVAMYDGTISFIFHQQNTENYELETFAHFDYREGRLPSTLARQTETGVGSKLYQNEDGVYYYHKATSEVKQIILGQTHKVVGKLNASKPGLLIVDEDNYAIADGEVLVTKSKRYVSIVPVDTLAFVNHEIYYTLQGSLYKLVNGKEVIVTTEADIVSDNKDDFVFQSVDERAFIAPK